MKKSIAVIIFGIIFILVGFIISNEQKELIKELSAKQNKAEAVCVKSDFTKEKVRSTNTSNRQKRTSASRERTVYKGFFEWTDKNGTVRTIETDYKYSTDPLGNKLVAYYDDNEEDSAILFSEITKSDKDGSANLIMIIICSIIGGFISLIGVFMLKFSINSKNKNR